MIIVDDEEEKEFGINTSINNNASIGSIQNNNVVFESSFLPAMLSKNPDQSENESPFIRGTEKTGRKMLGEKVKST